MTDKAQNASKEKQAVKAKAQPTPQTLGQIPQQALPTQNLIQRAKFDPGRLSRQEVLQLQRTVGNRTVNRLWAEARPRQPKLVDKGTEGFVRKRSVYADVFRRPKWIQRMTREMEGITWTVTPITGRFECGVNAERRAVIDTKEDKLVIDENLTDPQQVHMLQWRNRLIAAQMDNAEQFIDEQISNAMKENYRMVGLYEQIQALINYVEQLAAELAQQQTLNVLREAGLIGQYATSFKIRLSGKETHRGGKTVVFVTFGRFTKKTVVYKPSDIRFDRLMLGAQEGEEESVAHKMGMPTYRFLTADEGAAGFMEFLTTSLPQTTEDFEGIAHSLGRILVLAIAYGLRDLNKEGCIVQKNNVQLVDLEGMTETYTSVEGTGLTDMITGIHDQLFSKRNLVRNCPKKVADEMRVGADEAIDQLRADFAMPAEYLSRFVPINTRFFRSILGTHAGKPLSELQALRETIVNDLLAQVPGGMYTEDDQRDLREILGWNASLQAIGRGEVPVWYKEPGTRTIKSEDKAEEKRDMSHPHLRAFEVGYTGPQKRCSVLRQQLADKTNSEHDTAVEFAREQVRSLANTWEFSASKIKG